VIIIIIVSLVATALMLPWMFVLLSSIQGFAMTCFMALVAMIHFWCTLRTIHNPQRARDVPYQGCLPQSLQHQDNIKGPIVQDEEGKR